MNRISAFNCSRLVVLAIVSCLLLLPTLASAADNCDPPTAMLLLDKSGSMNGTVNSVTKWSISKTAINSMLTSYQSKIAFGLMFFPSSGTCTTGGVAVTPALNRRTTINTQINNSAPGGSTPIHGILSSAKSHLGLAQYNGDRKFAILITDGGESCHSSYTNETTMRNVLVAKVTELQNAGIKTFVIGFGSGVNVKHLNYMAWYGGTARANCNKDQTSGTASNNCFYNASDNASLTAALQAIAQVISVEICDGKDNDCNGKIDDLPEISCGTGACKRTIPACTNGANSVCKPKSPTKEVCDNEDNDCNGKVDDLPPISCGTGSCSNTVPACTNGKDNICVPKPKQKEVCDGKDNNCDGQIDELPPIKCGVGACQTQVQACVGGKDNVCVPLPPKEETCDNIDNNCNGKIDEDVVRSCKNKCGQGKEVCTAGNWGGCDAPLPAPETCDGKDNDCDGKIDEELTRPCSGGCGDGIEQCKGGQWLNCDAKQELPEGGCGCNDGDQQPCGSDKGICRSGIQICTDRHWGDCQESIEPADTEVCDGLDNNCDGQVDNGAKCKDGMGCFCGGCATACVNGECFNEGESCVGGFCVKDQCPDGQQCDFNNGSCKDKDPNDPDNNTSGTNTGDNTGNTNNTGTNTGDNTGTNTGDNGGNNTGTNTGDNSGNIKDDHTNGGTDPLTQNGDGTTGGDKNGDGSKAAGGCQVSSSGSALPTLALMLFLCLVGLLRRRNSAQIER